jgi:glycosyltransferase involved in cell wall biosynthesis
MNPKIRHQILHIDNVHSMGWTGGIDVTLKSLTTSDLANHYTFEIVSPAQALAVCARFKPDAIVVHDASSWKNLPWLWSLSRSAPLLINEHHYCEKFAALNVPSVARFHWVLKIAYGLAQRVIAISEGQRAWMLRHQLIREQKVFLIQSSRILDTFLTAPLKVRAVAEPFILGAYGRFIPMKGFDTLIQAVQDLANPLIQLRIGGAEPEEANLKQQAHGCDTIQFVGQVDDVPGFLRHYDAVVVPSRWESWGNVCLEARAAAKPIIAAAVDGLPEQIKDCGRRVRPNDPVALAHAIQEFYWTTSAALARMGEMGRNSARFAWENYLHQWQHLLEAVV